MLTLSLMIFNRVAVEDRLILVFSQRDHTLLRRGDVEDGLSHKGWIEDLGYARKPEKEKEKGKRMRYAISLVSLSILDNCLSEYVE